MILHYPRESCASFGNSNVSSYWDLLWFTSIISSPCCKTRIPRYVSWELLRSTAITWRFDVLFKAIVRATIKRTVVDGGWRQAVQCSHINISCSRRKLIPFMIHRRVCFAPSGRLLSIHRPSLKVMQPGNHLGRGWISFPSMTAE